MNWEALGAIGELLGASGVVISLAYLAIQIKATRVANKKAALQGAYSKYNEVRRSLFENPELAELFLNGLGRPEDLSGKDIFRFMVISETMFLNGEEYWLLSDKNMDDERLRNTLKYLAYYKSTPGGQAFWTHPQSQNLSPEFRSLINEQDIEGAKRFDLS